MSIIRTSLFGLLIINYWRNSIHYPQKKFSKFFKKFLINCYSSFKERNSDLNSQNCLLEHSISRTYLNRCLFNLPDFSRNPASQFSRKISGKYFELVILLFERKQNSKNRNNLVSRKLQFIKFIVNLGNTGFVK